MGYAYILLFYFIHYKLFTHNTRNRLCLLISKSFYMERSLLAGQQLICSCKCLIYYTKGFESIFYNIICIYVNVKFHNVTFFPFWSELPVIFHHGFRPSNTMGVSKQKTTEGTSEWEVSQTLLLLFFLMWSINMNSG